MLRSTSFVFDGIPSENYGVMIYFLDDEENRELSLGTDVEVIEDRLSKRIDPIHYGINTNKSMSFPLTFGSTEYLTDYDVDAILSWLTGHTLYKWLEYVDEDHYVRYRCHLNNMRSVYIQGLPVAFTCDVECDGQFAYEYTNEYIYDIPNAEYEVDFLNKSSYNGYFYPQLQLQFGDDCNGISIFNDSDGGREFKIDYFDRQTVEDSKTETVYETTLESTSDNFEDNILAWSSKSTPELTGNYGDILFGDDMWVMLPLNGDTAVYSEDKGVSWHATKLPHSGSWTGCYGNDGQEDGNKGFVAICTDSDQAIAAYSETGKSWYLDIIPLPVSQKWNRVCYVETSGYSSYKYIAVGGPESNIAAASTSGLSWSQIELPYAQNWQSVFSGRLQNGSVKMFAVGGDTNQAAWSDNGSQWYGVELPKMGSWVDGCYGNNGFVIICNSLTRTATNQGYALISSSGGSSSEEWDVVEMPMGAWSHIEYSSSGYVAVGGTQYANTYDFDEWHSYGLPTYAKNLIVGENCLACATGTNVYLLADSLDNKKGVFTLSLNGKPNTTYSDICIYADIENSVESATYTSIGEQLIYSASEALGNKFIPVAQTINQNLISDAVFLSATCEETVNADGNQSYEIIIEYIVSTSDNAVLGAPLSIRVEYMENVYTDLGFDGLIIDVDNKNQILISNKEALNAYEYFNMKFLRLIKGINKLRFVTNGGTCKVIMKCDFLRKVGG